MVKEKSMKTSNKVVLSGIFLALTMVLPLMVGGIPQIGNMLLPMHIPVLLCGFICGPKYGLIVGFIAPLLKFVLQGVPPLFPVGMSMCLELATYGFVTGLLYRRFAKTTKNIYMDLVVAMILGRVVWGICMLLLLAIKGQVFTFTAFIAGAITTALPGIILQLIIIPVIMVVTTKYFGIETGGETWEKKSL